MVFGKKKKNRDEGKRGDRTSTLLYSPAARRSATIRFGIHGKIEHVHRSCAARVRSLCMGFRDLTHSELLSIQSRVQIASRIRVDTESALSLFDRFKL